ncbi:PREDICTED: transmembrane protein 8A-like [Pygoscelis adeliae]|uniref:transmembrane protein 8A-like n=1 Tax=Pygoscelis adeliae TaxID=9238 RepID=UPI0004F4EEB5|nr:PREDICTED: transmembrane protein 8A-like [Pygoscelis adeliae]
MDGSPRLALGKCGDGGLFVTDYFTRTPRKLSPFRSFASIELFHFHIPEDTVIAVWNLITFKEQGGTFGDQCPDRSITVYFRSGAPSVINPLHTHFPRDTAVPGSFALTLTWTLPNRTTGVFNVTSPLPGDWFLAAHLPKDEGKISVKGLYEECQYLFQPQLIVQRLVNIAVLYPGYVTEQSMAPHNRSCLYKVFVPSYTSRVLVEVLRCRGTEGCPLWLRMRAKAPPLHNSTALDCREHAPCQLALDLPFWQHWYYVLVEKHPGVPGTVSFQVTVQLTDCSRPSLARPPFLPSVPIPTASPAGERCWPVRPTLRNELDTFSVHFYIFFGPNVSVPPDRPAVFVINLLPVLDSGGVLNLELRLNVSSLCGENVTVFGCLNHEVPLTSGDNASVTCETETLAGFLLSVNATASLSRLRIPYPPTGSWYLSLRSLCATEHGFEPCTNVTAEVYLRAYLSPCINDCGIYGQCKLLRTNNYLYAACECKAGWNGWGCTDNAEAFSYGFQLLSTLLLCLSNVMFVPPVAIAVRSHYLLEAAVYIFTMFFSTVTCGGMCIPLAGSCAAPGLCYGRHHGWHMSCTASEQCPPRYILKMDNDCFNTGCLPTFLAGLDLAWTGFYMASFSWEKWQFIRQPSSKWHMACRDYCPNVYLPYASSIGYILSLDVAKRFWRWLAHLPHPHGVCGHPGGGGGGPAKSQ